jgi:hypothetical protein
MRTDQWVTEVKRVAIALGLSPENTQELITWTIRMAYDELGRAEECFRPCFGKMGDQRIPGHCGICPKKDPCYEASLEALGAQALEAS